MSKNKKYNTLMSNEKLNIYVPCGVNVLEECIPSCPRYQRRLEVICSLAEDAQQTPEEYSQKYRNPLIPKERFADHILSLRKQDVEECGRKDEFNITVIQI